MGSLFEEDDEEFDLAAIEARHDEMEAESLLEKIEAGKPSEETEAGGLQGECGEATGIYPESDWEAIVEAVLFTMGNSVELRQLAVAIDQTEQVTRRVVEQLKKRYELENRGMQIIELESAFQMCTRAKYYENLIRVASAPKKHVLTDVVLETLSIIAYKQPVTKAEIAKIRGVSSDHAVNRLVEYGLVYEAGRMDAPGRPALFATTEEFLRRFGVGSMTDLPTMNPEQEEEIIQEVEEELQMKLEGGEPLPETDEADPAEEAEAEGADPAQEAEAEGADPAQEAEAEETDPAQEAEAEETDPAQEEMQEEENNEDAKHQD